MRVATVAEIHRYPVKSMQGERIDQVRVAEDGLRGDRSWAVRDERRGGIEGARKLPGLLGCHARFPEAPNEAGELPIPEIRLPEFPEGTWLPANHPALPGKLSALCDESLTLWPRLPASDADHYQRGAADSEDMMVELRQIFGRLEDEPLPDLATMPPVVFTSSTIPGTYFDMYPLFLLTRTSLASLAAAQPSSEFDPRRFRPNLLLVSEASGGFPENEWVGKRIRVGEAVFEIAMECPRCVMTTHAQPELAKDPQVMRALVKQNGGNLGVYASIETPGQVCEGDPVEIIE